MTDTQTRFDPAPRRNPSEATATKVASAALVFLASCGGEIAIEAPIARPADASALSSTFGADDVSAGAAMRIAADVPRVSTEPATPFEYEPHDPAQLSITLTRSHTRGDCPAYSITLRGDGTVKWSGNDFVVHAGDEVAEVDPAAVLALVERFRDSHFAELKDEYSDAMGECPSFSLRLEVDGRAKQVDNRPAGPSRLDDGLDLYAQERLDELARAIDELANVEQRVGTSAQRLDAHDDPHSASR